MLKDRKLLREEHIYYIGDKEYRRGDKNVLGWFCYDSYLGDLIVKVKEDKNKTYIEHEEYYITEFTSEASESDYHSYSQTYGFDGTYIALNLNTINTTKYFGKDLSHDLYNYDELIEGIKKLLINYNLLTSEDEIKIEEKDYLQIILLNKEIDDNILSCVRECLNYIRNYYDKLNVHITRMFGSYVLLKNIEGKLTAVKATPIPIKYCPLMIKLLKEIGGTTATKLIDSLSTTNEEEQTKMMCELINNVVIKGGYFDTNRPLNSCEANVLFGASETMSSAFKTKLIDAAVIVSNNLGTIITTNDLNTQGAVKRMTGLFHTSPNSTIMHTALESGITPVFPYTSSIDQLEGVKKAISLGYKKIAVSVAAHDNYLHNELAELEKTHNIKIYKFGLCSTGIDEETAIAMKNNADVIWSCASKYIKELIEPSAIAQVGIKIPVHIMTKQGWEIVRNHLELMNNQNNLDSIKLQSGINKPVILNKENTLVLKKKKEIHKCNDCPNPCV